MKISLVNVDYKNFHQVLKLELEKGDEEFVANNAYSLAEAYVQPNVTPRAILLSEKIVGFIMYGQWIEDKGDFWIGRLMVDKNSRKKGIARKAVQLAIDEMNTAGAKSIAVSFVPSSKFLEKFYNSLGFKQLEKWKKVRWY